MSNLLEIKNVVKNYGDFTALNNVSLTIPKGSVFGLLGPNGAGKTSLIRIINQITLPDSGDYFVRWKTFSSQMMLSILVICQKNVVCIKV